MYLYVCVTFSFLISFIHLPLFHSSNRTLMGPYGVDRAVHSMEFAECENGLGELLFCFFVFNHFQQEHITGATV